MGNAPLCISQQAEGIGLGEYSYPDYMLVPGPSLRCGGLSSSPDLRPCSELGQQEIGGSEGGGGRGEGRERGVWWCEDGDVEQVVVEEEEERVCDMILGVELLQDSDEIYSGLLRFTCCIDATNTTKSHDLHVTSEMTCSDVVPLLCQEVAPHPNGMAQQSAGHISLVQGEMERVLEESDKPLQIALDCSTRGLASPKFLFRLPVDPLTPDNSPSHRMRTSGFTSYVGALSAHSNPNLATGPASLPTANFSPHLPSALDRNLWLSTDGEQNSLYSTDSYNSLSSLSRGGRRLYHMSKSVSALEQEAPKSSPQRRKLTHMLSDGGNQNGSPPVSSSAQQFLQLPVTATPPQSPSTASQRMNRAKNSVGSFFTRSLRNNRRFRSKAKSSKNLTNDTDVGSNNSLHLPLISPEEKSLPAKVTTLISPLLADRKITMSTVMHIHYRDAKDALLYKSLLVSHKTKARDVIVEALERFNLKEANPKEFCLYEVVGRWQDVSQSLEHESSVKLGTPGDVALSMSNMSHLSTSRPAVTTIEEFVECYSRAIGPSERPYNLQAYLATQEGFTRRFELRQSDRQHAPLSRSTEILGMREILTQKRGSLDITSKRLSWADGAGSPLFGDTSHRRRGSRQNPQARASCSSAVLEGSETEEDILDEVKNRNRGAPMDEIISEEGAGKVNLREEAVTKTHPDSLLVDEGDPFAPEPLTPRRQKVLLSATSSSPDSGVVSFGKDKKLRHNSDELTSSRGRNQVESASVFNDTPTHISSISHSQLLKSPFLLNLKLHDVEKEPLVLPLDAERVSIASTAGMEGLKVDSDEDACSRQCVCLYHPDLTHDPHLLCSLELQANNAFSEDQPQPEGSRVYILHPTHPEFPVHLNGNLVVEPTSLSHGDLLSVYKERYLFLFQDYSSTHSQEPYSWRPQRLTSHVPVSPLVLTTPLPSSPIIKETRTTGSEERGGGEYSSDSSEKEESTTENRSQHPQTLTHYVPEPTYAQEMHPQPKLPPTQPVDHTNAACQTPTPEQDRRHHQATLNLDHGPRRNRQRRQASLDFSYTQHGKHSTSDNAKFGSLKRQKKSSRRNFSSSDSPVPPSPSRKSLFSFNLGEEDTIIRCLITEVDVNQASCFLGPSLLLAMCTEYCHKCHGPAATTRFVKKVVESLQEVVWRSTEKLTKWKPDPAKSSRPIGHCEELFPLLRPTVFWLANGLELHHLLTNSCTPLPPSPSSSSSSPTQQQKDPIYTLHSILVYAFQQMFYTVSKVLFYSLPRVLDGYMDQSNKTIREEEERRERGEEGGEDEIVEQAVDFLQALLDLMTDFQLHLQVVSCFYANLFFFINTTLFNSVMQLGPQRGVFTHSAGNTLRSSLTLLEGWACHVGFKDAVLHHLAKLSSILDILATSPSKLVLMTWGDLSEEFPVLHPAQLHHLLSHYIPPLSLSCPSHWSPSPADNSSANNRALVSESYEGHPGFTLPEASYSLSLSKTPPQPHEFQVMVDSLHYSLKLNSKNVDMIPVVESAPSPQIPTIFTSLPTPPAIPNPHHPHRNHNHHNNDGEEDNPPSNGHRRKKTKSEGEHGVRISESVPLALEHSHSNDSLVSNSSHGQINNKVSDGIGSNTESQEDLLDTNGKNNRRSNGHGLREKSNSSSKVAELINSYEETAKLSQSSSESVKITRPGEEREKTEEEEVEEEVEVEVEVEEKRVVRGKIGRVMSMVTEHAFSQPQTLVLKEYNIEEWDSSSFPAGAHFVNIQRGTKGFGILLVEQKDPFTGETATFVQQILPGSTADQCKDLKAGDRVLAIDGQLLIGGDFIVAEKYLKEAEDDVQLVLAPRSLQIL